MTPLAGRRKSQFWSVTASSIFKLTERVARPVQRDGRGVRDLTRHALPVGQDVPPRVLLNLQIEDCMGFPLSLWERVEVRANVERYPPSP